MLQEITYVCRTHQYQDKCYFILKTMVINVDILLLVSSVEISEFVTGRNSFYESNAYVTILCQPNVQGQM